MQTLRISWVENPGIVLTVCRHKGMAILTSRFIPVGITGLFST